MDSKKYFTGIRQELKRRLLMRGSVWAVVGTLPLIYAGIFFGAHILNFWGLALFGFWLICLMVGMIPFRKLTRLENNPNSLVIDLEKLTYIKDKKEILSVPLESIEGLDNVDRGDVYGIGVRLKNPVPKKVVVYNDELSTIYGVEGYSLFFPYFTERTCAELNEIINN